MIDACELSPSYVRAIAPYQPGKPTSELAREMGLEEASIVKLASNENPLGPSPLARAAVDGQLPELARYPDGNGFDLKQALSAHYGVRSRADRSWAAARTTCSSWSRTPFSHAGALGGVLAARLRRLPLATQAVGAAGIVVPARDFGHDLAAMAAAVSEDTRVLWIANPNNPTGHLRAGGASARVCSAACRAGWSWCWTRPTTSTCRTRCGPTRRAGCTHFPNLVITRTFSKAYGLAGAAGRICARASRRSPS